MPKNILCLESISLGYQGHRVLENISVHLQAGEIGCFLGPSGCGKTSLLRVIAGFDAIETGKIYLDRKIIDDSHTMLPAEQRHIGMVFQDYALFPHLNIFDNIAFGITHLSTREKKKRVHELLALVNLEGYDKRYPHQLSGGQQQRIAFIRALAPKPKLLLLDEPFGSQDVGLRAQLAEQVRATLKRENISAILVTHDQLEAFAVADKIGMLSQGALHQWSSPYDIYHRPQNTLVANFVGQGVLINGKVVDANTIASPLGHHGQESVAAMPVDKEVMLLVRPDDVHITADGNQHARIVHKLFQGSSYLYTLELDDGVRIESFSPSHHIYQIGDRVHFSLDMKHCVVLDRHTNARLNPLAYRKAASSMVCILGYGKHGTIA